MFYYFIGSVFNIVAVLMFVLMGNVFTSGYLEKLNMLDTRSINQVMKFFCY